MRLIHTPALTPGRHIALDAFLQELAEAGQLGESLRLWMSEDYFVVLGRGGVVRNECDWDRCRADGVPIIRRISGGGAVLQGPGCLNYSLVLSLDRDPRFRDLHQCWCLLLEKLAAALRRRGLAAAVQPISDIAVDGRKISGNAQARRRHYFLHHGTLLCGFDLEWMTVYLRHPPREPDYRQGRPHADFVANLPLTRSELEDLVSATFPTDQPPWSLDADAMQDLDLAVEKRFGNDAWNLGR